MGIFSALRPLARDVVRVDRSQLALVTALRNAVGVVVPLAVGAATGHLLVGLTISIGALNVAFTDRPGPYRLRAGRMLLAGLAAAASVFAGAATGGIDWLAVALAALWGFGGGLLVALGAVATQIGLTSVILLVVFAARPMTPAQAGGQAGLIMAGALLQTVLAVAAWPVRRFGPQRDALAAVFRQLAGYTHAPSGPGSAPPATAEITAAGQVLTGAGSDHSAAGEALRTLLDETERIRLELLALDDARHRLSHGDKTITGCIDAVMEGAGSVLNALADALTAGQSPTGTSAPLQRIEAAADALRMIVHGAGGRAGVGLAATLARVEALGGQLRAATETAEGASESGERASALLEAARPPALRPREPALTLRANLTLRSAACRHAVRLACCVAAADIFARYLGLPRSYWLPMTAAIVLKPDFAATFTRGLGRALGTIVGLVLASGLVYAVFGETPGRIVLAGVLMFVVRGLGPANYGLSVTAVTALVVVLTSFAGAPPEATIVERGLYTLAGGALALIAYAAWPTWERTQTPPILADLLDTYRRYFAAVTAGYLDPRRRDRAAMNSARQAARLARSNAEASIDRLRAEPGGSTTEAKRADSLLANSHRFVHSAMALETDVRDSAGEPAPRELRVFVHDVDTTLGALVGALRDPSSRLDGLPDLRADQRALATLSADAAAEGDPARQAGYRLAVIAAESDRIADSVNTMTRLLRYP